MREDWEECCFEDLLDYEQPTNYIVKSTAYNDAYETPVLTAGKSFIKGYTNETEGIFDNLPTIIFDDFTTASQFVNFKFKVKSSAMKILVPTSELVNMDFAYYAMQVNQIRSDTHKRYWISVYAKKKFLLPSLLEQKAIVSKIEELFSDLDKGIADLKKAQDQLVIFRQAVLKKAFEGDLTKEWREKNQLIPSFDFLQAVAQERKETDFDKKSIYRKKISHEFDFSRDKVIKTWSQGTLDKLIYIAARIGWRGLKKSEYTEHGPLFLSVHSLNHGKYVDYSEAFHISEDRYIESPEIQLEEGDVLLCKDGAGIGKIGIVKDLPGPGSVNSSVLIIRGMGILNQEFLYYLFSGPKLQSIVSQRITGSTTPHLFQNDIRKFELLIPPMEEQLQIVQEIESRLSVCDKVEQSITESLEKAKALRQSILKKAFEGTLLSEQEIKACKAAKNYEPASVLLKKIKAEKKK